MDSPIFSQRCCHVWNADADAEGLGPDGLDQEGGGRGGGEGRCGLFTRNTLHYMILMWYDITLFYVL